LQALVLREKEDLAVLDIPQPVAGPGEVLVRVRACGICGSDLRYLHGDNPWAKQTLGVDAPNPPNMILGHEIAGEIAAVGEGVDRRRIGERVTILAFKACGVCQYCRKGQVNLCGDTLHVGHGAGWGQREFYPGGNSTYIAVWSEMAYNLPESISFDEAVFLDGLGVAVRAVARAQLAPMEDAVVLGAGPIGLLILQVAKAYGARRVICTEVSEQAIAVARATGADEVIDARAEDIVATVLARTGGVDAVFDTVGEPETLEQGMKMLTRGGRLVLLATKSPTISFDAHLISGERTITTTANSPYPDFQLSIDLMAAGKINVKPMITHRFPLAQGVEAFKVAMDRERTGAIKVIIQP
jgi:2-desacetyl-2-hydroxyethyl bacteriochlorophyllide A dehydrogenase